MTDLTLYAAAVTFVAFIVACIAFSVGYGFGHDMRRREDEVTIARLNERVVELQMQVWGTLFDDADNAPDSDDWDDDGQADSDEMLMRAGATE